VPYLLTSLRIGEMEGGGDEQNLGRTHPGVNGEGTNIKSDSFSAENNECS
jgi:hypothetical protein